MLVGFKTGRFRFAFPISLIVMLLTLKAFKDLFALLDWLLSFRRRAHRIKASEMLALAVSILQTLREYGRLELVEVEAEDFRFLVELI